MGRYPFILMFMFVYVLPATATAASDGLKVSAPCTVMADDKQQGDKKDGEKGDKKGDKKDGEEEEPDCD